jgi:hypothetical protein
MNECLKGPYTVFIAIILCTSDTKYLGTSIISGINSESMEMQYICYQDVRNHKYKKNDTWCLYMLHH